MYYNFSAQYGHRVSHFIRFSGIHSHHSHSPSPHQMHYSLDFHLSHRREFKILFLDRCHLLGDLGQCLCSELSLVTLHVFDAL